VKLEDELKQKKSFKNPYHRMIVNIMFTGNWVQKNIAGQLRPFGISLQQHNVLRILRGQYPNPCTLGMIQERMLDRMSNATRLVDKLLDKELVERGQCPDNRRKVDIVITQKGLDLVGQTDFIITQFNKQYKSLSPEEAKLLGELLDKLRG
jgi:DNA-binding MarR family transcriptional regulator